MTFPISNRHEHEVKVRLTERHRQLLQALADNADVPVAVLARNILVNSLDAVIVEDRVIARRRIGSP